MFTQVVRNTVKKGKFDRIIQKRRQFSAVVTGLGEIAAKQRGIQYFKIVGPKSQSSEPSLPLAVPGVLANSLADSRQGVEKLAGDSIILTNLLQYLFSSEWIKRKESQTSILLANAPEKEGQHIYSLLTRPYVLSTEGWLKLQGLSDSQIMLLLASCVPNGMKVFPTIPLADWGLGTPVSPIPIADMWSKEDVNAVLQLGVASYIRAKLYPTVQQGNLKLIPLLAETQDPYHILSGALLWMLLFDLQQKTVRGLFIGAGQSPWRFLDIVNNWMGGVYWDVNLEGLIGALEDKSLGLGRGKPVPAYVELNNSLNKQYDKSKSRWIRRCLNVADDLSRMLVENPNSGDPGWGGPMYNYTPTPDELVQANEVQKQLERGDPLITDQAAAIELGQDLTNKINRE